MQPNANIPPLYDPTTLTQAHKDLLASLPFDDLIFRKLFDFIDGCMGSYRCDDSLSFTKSFLAKQGIQLDEHRHFFDAHGITLDYEIITDLEPKFPVDLNEFKRRSINPDQ